MLRRLKIRGFKSIQELDINFSNFNILFGSNSAGKSNILDAIQALSRLASERTIDDALAGPIRGNPIEVFSFPEGGLPSLLESNGTSFHFEAMVDRYERTKQPYLYRIGIDIEPRTGRLSVSEETLETLNRQTEQPKGRPRIRTEGNDLIIPSGQGRPRSEPLHQNHTKLSDERYSGSQYYAIEQCRRELAGWEIYYFDPREAMRKSSSPSQVPNIGRLGEHLGSFLYRMKNEDAGRFQILQRSLSALIPSIKKVDVVLDSRRGMLDILVTQGGVEYSARVMSEGTLRVLALCAIVLNPWGGSLIAIEEPENGVQPQRVELIAKLLMSLASERKQIIVTSHSPLFCKAALQTAREMNRPISAYGVSNHGRWTTKKSIDLDGPLFERENVRDIMDSDDNGEVLGALMIRGALNAF